MKNNTFPEIMLSNMKREFWSEHYKSAVIRSIECTYKPEIIREWSISDIVVSGDKALYKWVKRYRPLTDEELTEKYHYTL